MRQNCQQIQLNKLRSQFEKNCLASDQCSVKWGAAAVNPQTYVKAFSCAVNVKANSSGEVAAAALEAEEAGSQQKYRKDSGSHDWSTPLVMPVVEAVTTASRDSKPSTSLADKYISKSSSQHTKPDPWKKKVFKPWEHRVQQHLTDTQDQVNADAPRVFTQAQWQQISKIGALDLSAVKPSTHSSQTNGHAPHHQALHGRYVDQDAFPTTTTPLQNAEQNGTSEWGEGASQQRVQFISEPGVDQSNHSNAQHEVGRAGGGPGSHAGGPGSHAGGPGGWVGASESIRAQLASLAKQAALLQEQLDKLEGGAEGGLSIGVNNTQQNNGYDGTQAYVEGRAGGGAMTHGLADGEYGGDFESNSWSGNLFKDNRASNYNPGRQIGSYEVAQRQVDQINLERKLDHDMQVMAGQTTFEGRAPATLDQVVNGKLSNPATTLPSPPSAPQLPPAPAQSTPPSTSADTMSMDFNLTPDLKDLFQAVNRPRPLDSDRQLYNPNKQPKHDEPTGQISDFERLVLIPHERELTSRPPRQTGPLELPLGYGAPGQVHQELLGDGHEAAQVLLDEAGGRGSAGGASGANEETSLAAGGEQGEGRDEGAGAKSVQSLDVATVTYQGKVLSVKEMNRTPVDVFNDPRYKDITFSNLSAEPVIPAKYQLEVLDELKSVTKKKPIDKAEPVAVDRAQEMKHIPEILPVEPPSKPFKAVVPELKSVLRFNGINPASQQIILTVLRTHPLMQPLWEAPALHLKLQGLMHMTDAFPGFVAQVALEQDPLILRYDPQVLSQNLSKLLRSEYFDYIDWPVVCSGCPLLLTVDADVLLGKLREVEWVYRDSLGLPLTERYFKTSILMQMLTWNAHRVQQKLDRFKQVLPIDVLRAAIAREPSMINTPVQQAARVIKVLREMVADRSMLNPQLFGSGGPSQLKVGKGLGGTGSVAPMFDIAAIDDNIAKLEDNIEKYATSQAAWEKEVAKGQGSDLKEKAPKNEYSQYVMSMFDGIGIPGGYNDPTQSKETHNLYTQARQESDGVAVDGGSLGPQEQAVGSWEQGLDGRAKQSSGVQAGRGQVLGDGGFDPALGSSGSGGGGGQQSTSEMQTAFAELMDQLTQDNPVTESHMPMPLGGLPDQHLPIHTSDLTGFDSAKPRAKQPLPHALVKKLTGPMQESRLRPLEERHKKHLEWSEANVSNATMPRGKLAQITPPLQPSTVKPINLTTPENDPLQMIVLQPQILNQDPVQLRQRWMRLMEHLTLRKGWREEASGWRAKQLVAVVGNVQVKNIERLLYLHVHNEVAKLSALEAISMKNNTFQKLFRGFEPWWAVHGATFLLQYGEF